jgi:hypothetical protein
MSASVKVFKLLNGEELISEVTAGSDAGYFLDKPAQIMMQQNEEGKVGVGLAPYMVYVEGKVYLNKTAIAAEGEPVIQMRNEYSRLFGSGIQLASAGSVYTG